MFSARAEILSLTMSHRLVKYQVLSVQCCKILLTPRNNLVPINLC